MHLMIYFWFKKSIFLCIFFVQCFRIKGKPLFFKSWMRYHHIHSLLIFIFVLILMFFVFLFALIPMIEERCSIVNLQKSLLRLNLFAGRIIIVKIDSNLVFLERTSVHIYNKIYYLIIV